MIQLDHNHHPQLQNPDHKIIAYSLDHYLSHSLHSDVSLPSPIPPTDSSPPRPGPLTPVDLADPILPHLSAVSSPASPADGNSASPTRDRSSSLSPVPDTASPSTHRDSQIPPQSPPLPADSLATSLLPQEEEETHRVLEEEEEEEPQAASISRQSTPLSDLSTAPEQEGPTDGVGEPDVLGVSDKMTENAIVSEAEIAKPQDIVISGQPSASAPSPTSQPASQPASQKNGPSTALEPSHHPPVTNFQSPTTRMPSSGESTVTTPQPPPSSRPTTASPISHNDSKVITILELNAELLKVSMEFQARAIPMSEPRFQQISIRLQSNLAWLAAAADQSRQGSHSNMPLPLMECPTMVDFASMERIQKLYSDLPSVFSKEIARRQQLGIPINAHVPSSLVNPVLKRDRSDEAVPDPVSKRRDTGESKSMPPPAVPTLPMSSPSQTNFPLPIPNGTMLPPSQSPNVSMALPRLAPGLPLNTVEAQAAASSRDRARQMQIRQAVQQQQQHQHQLQAQGSRQMSPPSGVNPAHQQHHSQQNAIPGPSTIANNPSMTNALAALGPNAAQNFQILQNPSHPFIVYMNQAVQGFSSLSVQQQLQRMQLMQAVLRSQQQQQQQQQQPQQQGPPQQRNTGPMPSSHVQYPVQNAAPSSPASHHSPTMPHVHSSSLSPQNAMFPAGHLGRDNSSLMEPRMTSSSSSNATSSSPPSQQMLPAGLNPSNFTPQQRQLALLHQMRGNATNNPNPGNMVNPQQVAYQERMRQEQQRMAQAHHHQAGSPPNHIGSPMLLPGGDSFPALRSNNTIPGIARSTRSPSDPASSPVTPRVSSSTRSSSMQQEDYQRLIHAQQQQAQEQAIRSMAGRSPAFNQHQASNWPQSNPQQQNPQQQLQQQQLMQMGSLGQNPSYAMSPTGNTGHGGGGSFGSSPSPSNSQSWPQGPTSSHYPFSPSPNAIGHVPHDHVQTPRHMSSTPAPQQQMSLPNNSPATEPSLSGDFNLFDWGQQ